MVKGFTVWFCKKGLSDTQSPAAKRVPEFGAFINRSGGWNNLEPLGTLSLGWARHKYIHMYVFDSTGLSEDCCVQKLEAAYGESCAASW